MGIENITARILQEAKDEALKTKEAAEAQKAAVLEKAAREAAAVQETTAARAAADAKILKERRSSVAELEARKMRLALKQEVLEETFGEALEKIADIDSETYVEFLLAQLAPYREEGGVIALNARDQAAVREKLARALEGTKLVLGEETADIRGGFLLKQGRVFVNASLEKILESEKKQITAEVAGVLFE